MMEGVADEWYRSPKWDAAAREDFERRLARAKPQNRPQYLKIKALGLRDAGDVHQAVGLLQRVVNEYPTSLDAPFCLELLGDIARDGGRLADAVALYRQVVEARPDLNATSGAVHVSLAEVLNSMGLPEEALKALDLRPVSTLTLNYWLFRWNAALADAAAGVGEHSVARDAARRALALLDAPDQFSRHPGVGRATATRGVKKRLEKLAR